MDATQVSWPAPGVEHPHPMDAPEDLLPPHLQGRVIRYRDTSKRYGSDVVDRLLEYLNVGDELAYRALLEIRSGGGFGWPGFHRALQHGLPDNAPEAIRALFDQAEHVPPWVDWEQLRRGAIAYWRPGPIVVLALTASIGRGFAGYAPMKPTIFTGRLIDDARVGRRLVETLRYIGGVTTPDAMRRDGDGWKLTMRLRMIHQSVRHGCSHAEAWDWEDWGLPVNGTDNMIPGLEFSIGLAEMLDHGGFEWDAREREDIVALWRYISYVLGAPDRLLQRGMSEPNTALRHLQAYNAMQHPPDDTNRLMLRSLMEYAAHAGIGYDPMPDWLSKRLSPERRKALTYGLMYAWADERLAIDMDIPRTPYRHALKAVRPFMRIRQRFADHSPEADERACRRMLDDFSVVTWHRRDESPLADPDEIASDIHSRADRLRAIFSRH